MYPPKFKIGEIVKHKLTSEKFMILNFVASTDKPMYSIRKSDYAVMTVNAFELDICNR